MWHTSIRILQNCASVTYIVHGPEARDSIPHTQEIFSSPKYTDSLWGHTASYSRDTRGQNGREVKPTIQHYLVSRLRMCRGALILLLHAFKVCTGTTLRLLQLSLSQLFKFPSNINLQNLLSPYDLKIKQ